NSRAGPVFSRVGPSISRRLPSAMIALNAAHPGYTLNYDEPVDAGRIRDHQKRRTCPRVLTRTVTSSCIRPMRDETLEAAVILSPDAVQGLAPEDVRLIMRTEQGYPASVAEAVPLALAPANPQTIKVDTVADL